MLLTSTELGDGCSTLAEGVLVLSYGQSPLSRSANMVILDLFAIPEMEDLYTREQMAMVQTIYFCHPDEMI